MPEMMTTRNIPAELAIAAASLCNGDFLTAHVEGKVLAFANHLIKVAGACPDGGTAQLSSHWQPVSGRRCDYHIIAVTRSNEVWIAWRRLFDDIADLINRTHLGSHPSIDPNDCPTCSRYHDARLLADWCQSSWTSDSRAGEPIFPI